MFSGYKENLKLRCPHSNNSTPFLLNNSCSFFLNKNRKQFLFIHLLQHAFNPIPSSPITSSLIFMENSSNDKADSANPAAEENPSNPTNDNDSNSFNADASGNLPQRTPFTDLSQVDADLALARTLQEQERAYMMLRMGGDGGSDYGSWEADSFEHGDDFDEDDYDDASEEDYNGEGDGIDEHNRAEGEEDDAQNVELDPSAFPDDEAYARALQETEEQDMAARLLALAGINETLTLSIRIVREGEEDEEDHGGNSQDAWEELDPDELSYEELLALGEVVGTESRGLSLETIASLPSSNYKSQGRQEGISDSCVICRLDYEDDDTLIVLSCKHSYHSECINNWLQINKVCPVCSAEVSTSRS